MYLKWKKSGRSECGNYQASADGAYSLKPSIMMAGKAESAAANRAVCQRHAWKIQSQQAIDRVCFSLTSLTQSGGAVLSHALKVDSSQVSRWKLGRALVPARHCERIADLCFAFSATALRPDLEFYPSECGLKWRKRSLIVGGAES